MTFIHKWSLAKLVEHSKEFESAEDFAKYETHWHESTGQNSFLVQQGDIKGNVVATTIDKKVRKIPVTRVSLNFSTIGNNDSDKEDTTYIASVFSPTSVIYEILWGMCLNPMVDKSWRIFIGRSPTEDPVIKKNHANEANLVAKVNRAAKEAPATVQDLAFTIQLNDPDQHISRVQGYFTLVKENGFYLLFKDCYAHNPTTMWKPGDPPKKSPAGEQIDRPHSPIPPGINTLIPSRSELGMGKLKFTVYSAEDMYNRVLRILNKDK